MNSNKITLDQIVSLSKRRGFVYLASEIYGGLSGVYDFGPLGVELVNNLKSSWWQAMIGDHDNIFGLDGAILQSPLLWEASGHVKNFTDPMVEDVVTHKRYRADHLAGIDSTDLVELAKILKNKKSPDGNELSPPKYFNMMLETWLGAVGDSSSKTYLRPETAGAIYINFLNVKEAMRAKVPFGIAQIGKAFRNEISPRDFVFRVRELEQMEMQYFIHPRDQDKTYQYWRDFIWDYLINDVGISKDALSWHEHQDDERAHYAKAAHDVYFKFPFGSKELSGTHNRTDFDLRNHIQKSGKDMTVMDEIGGEKFIPNVIESTIGVGRLFLAVLCDAYKVEKVNGEERVVLRLSPKLAPYKVAVSPLLKNKPELMTKSKEVYSLLKKEFKMVMWDDNGNIGKRYRRQDEIGTPFCVTVDFDSLKDGSVTLRDRDTTIQKRLKIDELIVEISKALKK